MFKLKIPIKWMEKRIEKADSEEIDVMLRTITLWHQRRFPEYELIVWSLPIGNRQERKRQIDMMMRFLDRSKTLKRYRF